MDINNILDFSEKSWKDTQKFLEKISEDERQKINKTEIDLSYKVKELLDKKEIEISDIATYFIKNSKIKGKEEFMDIYRTVYTSSFTQKKHSIIFDAKTLKMLYIKTGIMNYIKPEDFFI